MKLSPTQQKLLDHIRALDGRIVRYPGGYWTHPTADRGTLIPAGQGRFAWWYSTQTVEALACRGILVASEHQTNGHGSSFVVEYRIAPIPEAA